MATSDQKQRDRLAALSDFVADVDGLGSDELDEHLHLDGIDPTKVVARVLGRVHQATWLDSAKARRAAPRSTRDSRARQRADGMDRQQLLHLLRRQDSRVSAQFRKNEDEMSDDDLRQLVVHLGLLDAE